MSGKKLAQLDVYSNMMESKMIDVPLITLIEDLDR
jgi:hypothetical protein